MADEGGIQPVEADWQPFYEMVYCDNLFTTIVVEVFEKHVLTLLTFHMELHFQKEKK